MRYGYARVSSRDQDLAEQIRLLTEAGCDAIRQEKASARSVDGRAELQLLLEFVRADDELVVTRIDRLARSIRDLADIVNQLEKRGVTLRAVQQNIDTSSASGRAFLSMLGVFAEFENELRRERQSAGIRAAKERGVYTGRPVSITAASVIEACIAHGSAGKAAKSLGISRASVYRIAPDFFRRAERPAENAS